MTNKTNKAILLFILFFFSMLKESAGQKSFLNKLKNIDLSRVFYPDSIISDYNEKLKRQESLGFIGNNYQRFEIHISSMIKSKADSFIYDISGKTRVKNNICEFIGTIKIISAEYNTSLPLMKDIGFPNINKD